MARLIDADALVKHLCEDVALKHFYGRTLDHAARNLHYLCELIDKLPTVDAEIVVRCQNCKHHGSCGYEDIPGWFCADGEKEGQE